MNQQNSSGSPRIETPRFIRNLFFLFAAWLATLGAIIISRSIHWPVVHDAPILLYMGFLSEHGMRLYRDIVEVQFPGAVLLYSFGRHVFGTTDLAFRIFDLCGLLIDLAAMLAIVGRKYWFAAIFGFAFYLLIHTGHSRSILNLGERDFFVSCLLGLGVACGVQAYRRGKPQLAFGFGLFIALASTIKPPIGLFFLAAAPIARELRKQQKPLFPYIRWLVAGLLLAYGIVLGYLIHQNAVVSFLNLEHIVMPIYYGMANRSFLWMLANLSETRYLYLFLNLLFLVSSSTLILLQTRLRLQVEQQVLLSCVIFGAASYFLQHKGFWYHREPFYYFFFLWLGWVLVDSVLLGVRQYRLAAIAVVSLALCIYPLLIEIPHWDGWVESTLTADLQNLHALDKKDDVQCVDETGGCLTVALNQQIIMPSGFLTDYLYFLNNKDPRLQSLRQRYLSQLQLAKPQFIVLTNEQWPSIETVGYEKLVYWPEFAAFLHDSYVLAIERGGDTVHQRGYRIYLSR